MSSEKNYMMHYLNKNIILNLQIDKSIINHLEYIFEICQVNYYSNEYNKIFVKEYLNGDLIITSAAVNTNFIIRKNSKTSLEISIELIDVVNKMIRLILSDEFYFINASMVSINNVGYMIIGKTQSGKSTTAMNLLNDGYKYETDEIVGINKNNGMVFGINKPAYIRNTNMFIDDNENINKLKVNNELSVYISKSNSPTVLDLYSNVVLLEKRNFEHPKNEYNIKEIKGNKKIMAIISNSFLDKVNPEIILVFSKLFKNIRLISITYENNIQISKLIKEKKIFI